MKAKIELLLQKYIELNIEDSELIRLAQRNKKEDWFGVKLTVDVQNRVISSAMVRIETREAVIKDLEEVLK